MLTAIMNIKRHKLMQAPFSRKQNFVFENAFIFIQNNFLEQDWGKF